MARPRKSWRRRAIVAEYFRSRDLEDAAISAVFLSGRAFPAFEERTLQVGGSLLWKVVKEVTGASDNELGAGYRKTGDLGAAVYGVMISRHPRLGQKTAELGTGPKGDPGTDFERISTEALRRSFDVRSDRRHPNCQCQRRTSTSAA